MKKKTSFPAQGFDFLVDKQNQLVRPLPNQQFAKTFFGSLVFLYHSPSPGSFGTFGSFVPYGTFGSFIPNNAINTSGGISTSGSSV